MMTILSKAAARGAVVMMLLMLVVAVTAIGAFGCDDEQAALDDPSREISAPVMASCSAPPVAGVIANGDDGNVPKNVVDGDLNTRWSQKGIGSWIQFDLASEMMINSVRLAWYEGNKRRAKFRIEASSDGASFASVFTGESSGRTRNFESYAFDPPANARFLRIVVDGNSNNTWASITEAQTCEVIPDAGGGGASDDASLPDSDGGMDPNGEGGTNPTPTDAFPIPPGFTRIGNVSTAFKHWGRHTTNYASGGSGPSERWDNAQLAKTNMVAGYEFKIGPAHGSRGDDEVTLKLPRCRTEGGARGNYIPFISWSVDGRNSIGGVGKEYPHPDTSHLKFNVEDPRPMIGNIKDGNWHGLLAAIYNDAAGVPTITLWYNPTASGQMQDYVFLGKSKDSGSGSTKITPGPVLPFSGEDGEGGHGLQVRIDEIPQNAIEVRKMFATEVMPPSN